MPQMAKFAWFATPPALPRYFGALGYIVGVLPLYKEGIEGSNRTTPEIKIFFGQYTLVNVLIVDIWEHIVCGDTKVFPNQLFD